MGDPADLAAVFDATARDLLRLARHLTGDRTLAEDLVQSTFLTAMERADSFDPERPLRPWLAGILLHHARHLHRKRGRRIDGDRLPKPIAEPDPAQVAVDHELDQEVDRALRSLPARDQELLGLRLREGRGGAEIARATGRDPGLVRMQLHRGLQRLRKLLPHSLIAALLQVLWQRSATAAIRSQVLVKAGLTGGLPAATSLTAGGLAVSNKALLLTATAGLLVTVSVLLLNVDQPVSPETSQQVAAPTEVDPTESAAPRPSAGATPVRIETPAADEIPSAEVTFDPPASFRNSLGGLRGRLLQADSSPVSLQDVALLELTPGEMISDLARAFDGEGRPPRFEIARSRTAEDGSFLFEGAHPRGLHAIGVDLGGPCAALRIVEIPVSTGEITSLGDLYLPPAIRLIGRVVNEEGQPIAGARVRAVPLPASLTTYTGVEHYRRGGRIINMQRDRENWAVLRPPEWMERIVERLPVPTAVTDGEGRFTLERVEIGLISTLVDHPAYVARVFGPTPSGMSGTRDQGELELLRGRLLEGRIVDGAGQPVADLQVIGGPTLAIATVAITTGECTTDSDGCFSIAALPEDAEVVLAARRGSWPAWAMHEPTYDEQVEWILPDLTWLEVLVRDAQGAPIEDAELGIARRGELDEEFLPWLDHRPAEEAGERLSPGRFRFDALLAGAYRLAIRSDRFGAHQRTVVVTTEGTSVTVDLSEPRPVPIRVVEEGSGSPVAFARVTLFGHLRDPAIDVQRTGPDGRVVLGPENHPQQRELKVRVEHPAYATLYAKVTQTEEETWVALGAGGAVRGAITDRGNPPAGPLMVAISYLGEGADVEELPRILLTDARGGFFLERLTSGRYWYEVLPRVFEKKDLLGSIAALAEGHAALEEGLFEVESNRITELAIELQPAPPSGAGLIVGSVEMDGEPMAGAQVTVIQMEHPKSERKTTGTSEVGLFQVAGVMPGRTILSVHRSSGSGIHAFPEPLYHQEFRMGQDETREFHLSLRDTPVPVRVTSRGAPVSDLLLRLEGISDELDGIDHYAVTDSTGLATIRAARSGRYLLNAFRGDLGRIEQALDVPTGGFARPLEAVLDPGTPCEGTFTLDPILAQGAQGPLRLRLRSAEPGVYWSASQRLGRDTRSFQFIGLSPGQYEITVWSGDQESSAHRFDLPPEGNRDLRIEFVAR